MTNKLAHCAGGRQFPCWYGHTPHPMPPNSHLSSPPRDRDHLPKSHYLQTPGTRHTLTFKNTVVLEVVGEPWATWSTTLGRLLMTNSYMGHILLFKHGTGAQAVLFTSSSAQQDWESLLYSSWQQTSTQLSQVMSCLPCFSNCYLYWERRKRGVMQSWSCL